MTSLADSMRNNNFLKRISIMKPFSILLLCSISIFAQNTASYRIDISVIWSDVTHPHPNNAFPDGPEPYNKPHFSPIIGAVHDETVSLWYKGGIASDALKSCAESGSSELLKAEIAQYLSAGGEAPKELSTTFTVDSDHYFISFASMLAPTPDWIFGINNLSLRENGTFVNTKTIELFPVDAGTKNGHDYRYDYVETSPRELIRSLKSVSPFSHQPVVILTLTRTDTDVVSLETNSSSKPSSSAMFTGIRNGNLQYSIEESGVYSFSLYGLSGRELFTSTRELQQGVFSFASTQLGAGVHLAEMSSVHGTIQHRVIID